MLELLGTVTSHVKEETSHNLQQFLSVKLNSEVLRATQAESQNLLYSQTPVEGNKFCD